jgi:two-component system NarL family sensor kinase
MATWQDGNTVVVWLAAGFFLLILIIGALLFFTQIYIKRKIKDAEALTEVKVEHQKKLLVNSIQAQEKERERVASEIHDGLIYEMTMLSMQLNQPGKEEESKQLLKNCTALARQISHDLTPPLIESCHLNEILEGMIDQIETHITFLFQSGLTERSMITSFKLNIVRIIQEVINNTLKHGAAKSISLQIRTTTNFLALIYKDDGKGFIKKEFSEGLGQKNMAMRIELLNGRFKLKTKPGKGVRYIIVLPINQRNG